MILDFKNNYKCLELWYYFPIFINGRGWSNFTIAILKFVCYTTPSSFLCLFYRLMLYDPAVYTVGFFMWITLLKYIWWVKYVAVHLWNKTKQLWRTHYH